MNKNVEISLITGISVLLSLYIGEKLSIDSLFYASIAAVVVSQSSHVEVLRSGLKRIYGTVVGAIIGILFFNFAPHSIFFYFLGIMFIVFICSNYLKAPSNMACIVFLAISTNLKGISSNIYAINRVLDTGVGVISAVLVAYIFSKILNKKEV